mmetsp:Transcript_8321/g.18353  ORF Transcript_8321/g.18353 Transcript_8321/m.18353 type:complete len:90 (+) Transcript_8321:2124-2393(+)
MKQTAHTAGKNAYRFFRFSNLAAKSLYEAESFPLDGGGWDPDELALFWSSSLSKSSVLVLSFVVTVPGAGGGTSEGGRLNVRLPGADGT